MLLVVATSCARGDGEADPKAAPLDPAFPPVESVKEGAPSTTGAGASQATGDTTAPSGERPAAPGTDAQPSAERGSTQGSISDAEGDVTPTPLDPAPKWADLTGAQLTRLPDGFELRVRLGDTAPTASPDEDHTMNIASFYELDGDGHVDFEVWLNLGPNGWGGSWWDNGTEQVKFQEDAQLEITLAGTEVVAKFPVGHIGGAERFRWSLASEYGRYEAIGTTAMARDDAPDDDQPAAFPN